MSLTRFNSIRALTFLALSQHAQTMFLYSSHITCPYFCVLYFTFLSLARSGLFIHTSLLMFLSDYFFARELRSLEEVVLECQLAFLGPSSLRVLSSCDLSGQIFEEAKICSFRAVVRSIFTLISVLRFDLLGQLFAISHKK